MYDCLLPLSSAFISCAFPPPFAFAVCLLSLVFVFCRLLLPLSFAVVLTFACVLVTVYISVCSCGVIQVNFREFWTSLAGELDRVLLEQIVRRRLEMTQDEVRTFCWLAGSRRLQIYGLPAYAASF